MEQFLFLGPLKGASSPSFFTVKVKNWGDAPHEGAEEDVLVFGA